MVTQTKRMTVEAFETFVQRSENTERDFEFIGGEIYEVPSNPFVSQISMEIAFHMKLYLRKSDIEGHLTGEAGGYMVAGERYAPDVAFISKARQPELVRKGYNPLPPNLVVEVISDHENAEERDKLRIKITNYLSAGVVVWVFNPFGKYAEVHQPGAPAQIITADGTLDGGDVLPGFRLELRDIFPTDDEMPSDDR